MIRVEKSLGNAEEPAWAERLAHAQVDLLHLDQWQAQKNRFRLKTAAGVEVIAILDRRTHLRDGDVLSWNEAEKSAVVARVSLNDVMVIRLTGVLDNPPEAIARIGIELGHALGNQHWPAVVKGTTVYVPLTVAREVMASVMKTHAFEGIEVGFARGAEVIPYLAPHEARRLFGGADSTPHSHIHSAPAESRHAPTE